MREQSIGRSLGLGLLLLAVAACLVPSSALASTAHEFKSSFGPDGSETTHFQHPASLAVDQGSHDVYVADLEAGTVSKFDETGAPTDFSALGSNEIGGFSFFFGGGLEGLNQIAVNSTSHDFYVVESAGNAIKAFEGDGEPAEFSAGPGAGTNKISGSGFGGEFDGVAVDANGDLYVGDFENGVHVFAPDGEEITTFSAGEACNLAVDSHGAVYVAPYTLNGLPLKKFIPSEFPLTPTTTYSEAVEIIDPNKVFGLAIDPASDELYVDEHNRIAQYDEEGTNRAATFAEGGPGALAESEGVAVDGTGEDVFVSDAGGERQVEIFVPPPPEPPSVGSISFANVTATSADLQAQINPKSFDTHYRFEYLTEAEYRGGGESFADAQSTPEADLGAAGEPQSAHAHIVGLQPGTTYLFRVEAENANNEGSPVFSAEATAFTTFAVSAPGLPDGRAYEMVSPPQKLGEVFPPEPRLQWSGTCENCLPGTNDEQMPMQSSADGEEVLYEGFPFSGGLAAGPNEYLSKRSAGGWGTQSLSTPLFSRKEGQGYKAFSDDLSRGVLYQIEPALSPEAPSRGGDSFANLYLRDGEGSLQPLVTQEPPQRDPGRLGGNRFRIGYAAANSGAGLAPALSHMAFEANDALTATDPPNAPAAPAIAANEKNLYEWVDGQLRLVNVAPGNVEAVAGAVIGSGRELSGVNGGADFDHAVSADGSRIFWSEASGRVYARIDGEETKKIEDLGKFLLASADGSKLLLSDGCLYDLGAGECEEDLAQGEGEKLQGILGAAEDLSRVYFVDTAALTPPSEENGNEEHAEAGKLNLYGWSEGTASFIGSLDEADNGVGPLAPEVGDWKPSASSRTAQVSPDGRYLAFMSRAPLTGYDNNVSDGGECRHAAGHASACYEVFEYEAESGRLTCASCNPTGEQPLGGANLSLIYRGINGVALSGFPQPGNLTAKGQGRLFFESQDDLSTRDTNGHIQDVYEWEPEGVGSCEEAGGCVSLISSGRSSNDSFFLDATPSGDDAFIVTRQQLLPQDGDEKLDLYDARVGGSPPPGGEIAPCAGETCKGPQSATPQRPLAGSAKRHGAGNPRRPHKKKHKKHNKRSAKHIPRSRK